MPDANEWIKGMLNEMQERLESVRAEAKGGPIPEQAVDILALFASIPRDSPAARGLNCLVLEIIREVHHAVFEQAVLGAAEIAAEIFEEEARP